MLRVGTDCSGIDAPIQALLNIGIPFTHEFSCDIDEYCRESITANYQPKILYDDMTKKRNLPDIDLYVCGFPCQPFSHAGNREGIYDKRGNLFWYCIDVIKQKNPAIFLLENVKGLLTMNEGETFTIMLTELYKLSYKIKWSLLQTYDYGLPQQRERLFIIGIRNDIELSFEFPLPIPMKELVSILDQPGKKENIPEYLKRSNLLKRIPKDSIFIDIGFTQGNFPNSNKYSPCLTTQNNLWCVPYKRRATVKECLRLQGFPDDFCQVVSDRQLKIQLGNSITVTVLEEIFKKLFMVS